MVDHTGLGQQRMMLATPDHLIVRLVAKNRHVAAAHQIGQTCQIVERGHSTRRIVSAIEEDRPRLRIFFQESLDVGQVRPEVMLLAKGGQTRPGAARRRMFGK